MRSFLARDDSGWPQHVLVMDSDQESASLLVHHFQQLGCAVVHVDGNAELWAAIQSQLPDLLVIERRLRDTPPVQQLIARLLADPTTVAGCRIVVASGLQFADLVPGEPTLHEVGAHAVIDEPYTQRAVRELIEEVIPVGEDHAASKGSSEGADHRP
jgi:CheY-like chemotaxis protein